MSEVERDETRRPSIDLEGSNVSTSWFMELTSARYKDISALSKLNKK